MKQLSIIVPVYNVEKYIRPCVESLFRQDLAEECFEVIIVNDGTQDNSMEMIKDIVAFHTNITVINQENQGLSTARNNGTEKATGEYLLYVDSDDLLAEHSLSALLENAIQSKADLIVANFKKMEDEEIDNYLKNPPALQKKCEVHEETGRTLLMEHLNPRECYVWRTIYRREFLVKNNIRYIPHICFEDIPFTHECYLKADRCLRIDLTFYIYRIGHASITSIINLKKGKDFGTSIAKTWELRNLPGLPSEIRKKLIDNVFASLSVLLYSIINDVQDSADRKAILKHLKEAAPNMYFDHGMKQKLVNLMYDKLPYTYISFRVFIAKLMKMHIRQ